MRRYYFTFGRWSVYPYQNTYLIVVASDHYNAVIGFREKYPDHDSGFINCESYFNEEQWETVGKYYADKEPAEIIWTESCFGKKPEGYDDVFIFVPEMRQIICISEGTGGSILPEDIEAGYVDYIYYNQYELSGGMEVIDGGKILLKEMLKEKYSCLADSIAEVLNMAYGSALIRCMIL